MNTRLAALEEVGHFCDVRERIALVPPSASIRGIYFRSIEMKLEAAGQLERYRSMFPERVDAVRWLPMSYFLERLTIGAALLKTPAEVHRGMFEIGRNNAVAFSSSLLGKLLIRMLSRDPRKLLQQGAAGRRQSYSVGHWELTFPSEQSAVVHMTEEYLYIESYMLGAAYGTFDAIGVSVEAQANVVDKFTGTHILRWGPA